MREFIKSIEKHIIDEKTNIKKAKDLGYSFASEFHEGKLEGLELALSIINR